MITTIFPGRVWVTGPRRGMSFDAITVLVGSDEHPSGVLVIFFSDQPKPGGGSGRITHFF